MRLRHTRLRFRFASRGTRFAPSCLAPSTTLRRGRMRRSVLVALLALAGACRERPDVAGPERAAPRLEAKVLDPAQPTGLARPAPTATLEGVASYGATVPTGAARADSMRNGGA